MGADRRAGVKDDRKKVGKTSASNPQPICAEGTEPCMVVGIGASEGGVEPLERLFTILPLDLNISLVVVTHPSEHGHSLIVESLQRCTAMEVVTAVDGALLLPDKVHVVPSGVYITVDGDRLRLKPQGKGKSAKNPVGRFLASLSKEKGERSIAVLLSGAGVDGAEGAKRIRDAGGLVLVHDPATAANTSMPGSLSACGAADRSMPIEEIADRIGDTSLSRRNIRQEGCSGVSMDKGLHSADQRLIAVNPEPQLKIEELSRLNRDMEKILATSELAAILLDRDLSVKRFSPSMAAILNLTPADMGRPLRRIAGIKGWPGLLEAAGKAMESASPLEREVQTEGNRYFKMRLLPCLTGEKGSDGVVMTLVDISELKQAEEESRNLAIFPLENPSPVLRIGSDGSLLFANRAAESMLECGISEPENLSAHPVFHCVESAIRSGLPAECEIVASGSNISFVVVPFPDRGYANLYGRDITERKQAEARLSRAKDEWERTFDSVPDLIAIMNEEHRITRVNRAMAARLGVSPEECIGKSCFHGVHGTDCPPEHCPHLLTLADGREHAAEIHVENLDGDFLITTTPLLDESGKSMGSVHVARDVTERKRAEKELLQVRNDLDRAQEVGQIGSWRMDIRRNVLTWSDENHRIFGVPQGTPLSYETFLEKVLPDDREYVDMRWKAALSGMPYDIEHRIVADGRLKWVREKAYLEFYDDGSLLGGFGITQDISERKKSEEEILRISRRSILLAETTATLLASGSPRDAVSKVCGRIMKYLECQFFFNFLADDETGKLRLNSCAGIPDKDKKRLHLLDYGSTICGCAGRDACRIIAEDIPATQDPRTEIVNSYGILAYACHPLMARGKMLGTLSFGTRNRSRFTDDDLSMMKAVADQIAIAIDRKRYEQQLLVAREAADEASRAKSLFLANMSHELRTPLTGVLGMLEVARAGELDERQREALDAAQSSGRSLLLIINDILDLTRIESGKIAFEEERFSLRKSVSGSVDIFIPEARRKGIGLAWSVADGVSETVVGDRVRLQQVLTNLVGNAVKFTAKGKVELQVSEGGESGDGKKRIVFTVADTGIGIPDEKKELIFAPFSQADASHTRRYGGTGLGLTISRQLAELMGGELTLESRMGEGTVFTFTLPLLAAEGGGDSTAEEETTATDAVAPADRGKKARLLIAEDDEVTRKVLGFMLQRFHFDLDFAANGQEAVSMWERGGYDLIIMDGQMPVMDGFTATRIIRDREEGAHVPILAMTAHAMKSDEERCIEAGMDGYVSKPIDFRKCVEIIRGLLGRRGGEETGKTGGGSRDAREEDGADAD